MVGSAVETEKGTLSMIVENDNSGPELGIGKK